MDFLKTSQNQVFKISLNLANPNKQFTAINTKILTFKLSKHEICHFETRYSKEKLSQNISSTNNKRLKNFPWTKQFIEKKYSNFQIFVFKLKLRKKRVLMLNVFMSQTDWFLDEIKEILNDRYKQSTDHFSRSYRNLFKFNIFFCSVFLPFD